MKPIATRDMTHQAPMKTYRVIDAAGGEIVCDTVRARSSTEAREIVREAHLGEGVTYVVYEITAFDHDGWITP